MLEKHPRVFNKIYQSNYSFLINAYDLPINFYLVPHNKNPILKAIHKNEIIKVDATIKGSLLNLLKMFEGTLDGDAAFFSKDIIIEGSTAASVALRNAIDGEDMNIIEDLSSIIKNPIFANLIKQISYRGVNKYSLFQKKLDTIIKASNFDIKHNQEELDLKINNIYKELDDITESLKKITKEQIRKKSDYTSTEQLK
jgi:predicted lipid carrier protein YhbT